MEQFYRDIQAKRMDALWRHEGGAARGPDTVTAPYEPCLWRWSDIDPAIRRAGELVQPSNDDQRRALTLNNPSVRPMGTATHTVSAAVQMVLPGETAPSHRHTMAAIRFVMRGSGAVTFIDGEGCTMQPGDLVLTPGWTWHGHINRTEGPMVWMDSLDVPLIGSLKAGLYEDYPDQLYPATKPVDDSVRRFGGGFLRPTWDRSSSLVSPLLTFPWAQTEHALHELAGSEVSPYDDVAFQYTNPTTGGHALPTIGCWIQMIRPGVHTKAHRHATASIYHVFRGRGSTVVDSVQIDWQEGDFFAVPPWAWHEHANTGSGEEAVLFSTNDIPVFESLGLYREYPYEASDGYQQVRGDYAEVYGKAAPAPGAPLHGR
jgi:gentisate 1,2-dioxygenase